MTTHDIPTLDSTTRTRTGTRYAQRDREAGRLPGVVYGHKQQPVHITLDAKAFADLLEDEAHLVAVTLDGKPEHCLIKAVQWDHLGKHMIHVDLARVDLGEEVEVEVELTLTGDAVGLEEEGAILENPVGSVTVKCRADSIPEHLEHDVSALKVGDSLTVADLVAPAGVQFTDDPETVIAFVSIAEAIEEEEPVEAEEAEPEVIGKEEEEGEEAEAGEDAEKE